MLVRTAAALTLLMSAAFAAPQTDDPAKLLPSDTLIYFGSSGASGAAKGGAMQAILAEPEVKAFLAKPIAAADKTLKELLTQGGISAEDGQRWSVASMMGSEGKTPFGKLFLAMTHFSVTPPSGEADPKPDVGLVVGVELLDPRDIAVLKALWGRIPWTEETGNYKGQDFLMKSNPDGVSLRLTFIGNLAVATLSEKSMQAVVDRAKTASGDSLAKAADYTQLLGTAGGQHPGSSTWIIRVAPMASMINGVLGLAMASAGSDKGQAEAMAKVSSVVQGLGLDGIRWAGGTNWREASGRVKGAAVVSVTPGAPGLLPRCLADSGTIDRKIVERVPGDSLSMSAGSIDWLPAVYDFAMTTFKALEPGEYDNVQAMIKQFMGESDLREDLLVNLHGTLLTYEQPGSGMAEQPASIIRVGLKNPDAFVKALRALASSISSNFLDSPDAVSIKESDHEGRKLYEIDLSKTPLVMSPVQPAFAVDGGELVLCPQSTKALKTALNGTKPESSLAKNAELAAFLDKLAAKGELASIGFSDNAKRFGAVYGQFASMAQMFGGAVGDVPIDLSLMPSEAAITKHLTQCWSGSYVTEGGSTFVGHSEGQFQLSDFLPIVVTAGIVGVSIATGSDAYSAEPKVEDPFEIVQRHLGEISAGMTVFKISEGRYPESIDDLVKPLADYPEGCLGKSEAPVDPWGNPYRFKLNAKGKPQLWSMGPDGVDQGGESDDIVKS